jgi:hypothetical protein
LTPTDSSFLKCSNRLLHDRKIILDF